MSTRLSLAPGTAGPLPHQGAPRSAADLATDCEGAHVGAAARQGGEHGVSRVEGLLRRAALFEGVDPSVVQALGCLFEVFTAPRAAILFRQGEIDEYLYVVLAGKVKLTRREGAGRQVLVDVMGPPEVFGELALCDPGPRAATATVISEATLARLPGPTLHGWAGACPQVAGQLLGVLAARARRAEAMLADRIRLDVPGRVAAQLLQLAQRFGAIHGDELHVTHGLTQRELAALIGASREGTNRALASFAARGWLRLEHKGLAILERPALATAARGSRLLI